MVRQLWVPISALQPPGCTLPSTSPFLGVSGSSLTKWAQCSHLPGSFPCHYLDHSTGHISDTALVCCYLTPSAPQTMGWSGVSGGGREPRDLRVLD